LYGLSVHQSCLDLLASGHQLTVVFINFYGMLYQLFYSFVDKINFYIYRERMDSSLIKEKNNSNTTLGTNESRIEQKFSFCILLLFMDIINYIIYLYLTSI
jgi:hypothetical protein